jgi:hypothetical protein
MIQRNEDNGRIALILNDDKIVCCRKNIKSNEARGKNITNERMAITTLIAYSII